MGSVGEALSEVVDGVCRKDLMGADSYIGGQKPVRFSSMRSYSVPEPAIY